jgi:hypothetical protein
VAFGADDRAAGLILRRVSPAVAIASLRAVYSVPGLAIAEVAGSCGAGAAALRINQGRAQFRAPGSSTYGAPADVSGFSPADPVLLEDGEDPDKYLVAHVYPSRVPAGLAERAVYLQWHYQNDIGGEDLIETDVAVEQESEVKVYARVNVAKVKVWLDTTVWMSGLTVEIRKGAGAKVAPDSETHADVLEFGSIAAGNEAADSLFIFKTQASSGPASGGLVVVRYGFDRFN